VCVACAGGDAVSDWPGTISDSAGVTVVSNPAGGLWTVGEAWTLEQDLFIGEAEGDPDYLFGHVTGICVASDHAIYVVDQGASTIRVYSRDGVFLNAFGESDAGPSGLGMSLGPCLMEPGDTLAIPDMQQFRVSRFTPDGASVSGWRIDIGSGIPVAWGITDAGRIAAQLRFGILGQPAPGTPDAVVRWNPDGSVADTIVRFPPGDAITRSEAGARYTLLAAAPVWTLTPQGDIWYGSTDAYRITQYDSAGTPTRILTKPFEPQPVTDVDRQLIGDAVQRVFPAALIQQVMGGINFAEVRPVYYRFLTGPRATLWVQHVVRPGTLSEYEREAVSFGPEDPEVFLANPRLTLGAPDWDVFDAEGRFLGVVAMPDRFQAMRFVGDELYGIWRDDVDVEYVMRLRVTGVR
jgi:hypothetical protein